MPNLCDPMSDDLPRHKTQLIFTLIIGKTIFKAAFATVRLQAEFRPLQVFEWNGLLQVKATILHHDLRQNNKDIESNCSPNKHILCKNGSVSMQVLHNCGFYHKYCENTCLINYRCSLLICEQSEHHTIYLSHIIVTDCKLHVPFHC